ncbi:hypothetical protein C8R42DRAFT_638494 [Lentinula raphanica]|nr:hypothetical protein C8R42DRAFT_638494 [Lentinula raphanica]
MDKLTRIAIHAGCLCYAKNAGSRLSKWRLCPVHTSFNVPSSESKASEQGDLIDNDSRSSLESFDSRFTRLTPPSFEHAITEQEWDCGNYWAQAADVFILGVEEIKIKDWRIRRDSKGALHRATAKLDQLEHGDSILELPELFDSCITTEGNNIGSPNPLLGVDPTIANPVTGRKYSDLAPDVLEDNLVITSGAGLRITWSEREISAVAYVRQKAGEGTQGEGEEGHKEGHAEFPEVAGIGIRLLSCI